MSKYRVTTDGVFHSNYGKLDQGVDGSLYHPGSRRRIGRLDKNSNTVFEDESEYDPMGLESNRAGEALGESLGQAVGGLIATGIPGLLAKIALGLSPFIASLVLLVVAYPPLLDMGLPNWLAGLAISPIAFVGAFLSDLLITRKLLPGASGRLLAALMWGAIGAFLASMLMERLDLSRYHMILGTIMFVVAAAVRWLRR